MFAPIVKCWEQVTNSLSFMHALAIADYYAQFERGFEFFVRHKSHLSRLFRIRGVPHSLHSC